MTEEKSGKFNALFMPLAIILAGVIIAGAMMFNNRTNNNTNSLKGSAGEQANANQPVVVNVSAGNGPVRGSESAKVTMIEFSDYECPFCEKAESTLKQIMDKYNGQIKLVYRNFPLQMHQYAQKAAEAALCAGEQGKYWEYHDKLYANQSKLKVTDLKKYAKDLGLDTNKFNSSLDSGKFADQVKKDLSDGEAAGVDGTPAFFINGTKLVGAQPLSEFTKIIDAELKK